MSIVGVGFASGVAISFGCDQTHGRIVDAFLFTVDVGLNSPFGRFSTRSHATWPRYVPPFRFAVSQRESRDKSNTRSFAFGPQYLWIVLRQAAFITTEASSRPRSEGSPRIAEDDAALSRSTQPWTRFVAKIPVVITCRWMEGGHW
jgi:hypothetical protein